MTDAEYSAARDYYRLAATGASNQFWGGAGAPYQYDYYKENDPNTTADDVLTGMGEHDESARYTWAGYNSPQYVAALNKAAAERTALDNARLASPGAIGAALSRPDLVGLNSLGMSGAELAFYDPATLANNGIRLTAQQQAARDSQIANSTPAAQDDGDGGFGPLQLAMLALAIYSGGASAGLWGAAEGIGAGAAGAFDTFATTDLVNAGWNSVTGYGLSAPYSGGFVNNVIDALGSQFTPEKIGMNFLTQAGGDAFGDLAAGRDIDIDFGRAGTGMITGGIGGAMGSAGTDFFGDVGMPSWAARPLGGAFGQLSGAVLNGADLETAGANALIGGASGAIGGGVGSLDLGGQGSFLDQISPTVAKELSSIVMRGGDAEAVKNALIASGVNLGTSAAMQQVDKLYAELKNYVTDGESSGVSKAADWLYGQGRGMVGQELATNAYGELVDGATPLHQTPQRTAQQRTAQQRTAQQLAQGNRGYGQNMQNAARLARGGNPYSFGYDAEAQDEEESAAPPGALDPAMEAMLAELELPVEYGYV
jgi:hypothetical protein